MKVSAITLININNYGSLLQAYATQKTIEGLGHEVEFVNFVASNGNIRIEADSACDKRGMKPGLKRATYKIAWMANQMIQRRPFDVFRKRYLKIGPRYANQEYLIDNPPQADVYISGSDMLWSSKLNRGHSEKQFYLNYAPEGKPRIAFSASIGEESLPQSEIDFIKPLLERYSAISMRENSGVDLVRSMGLGATKVLDPTLMLTSDEWRSLAEDRLLEEKYMFVYFLHDHVDELAAARVYADNSGLRMVRLAFNPRKKPSDDIIVYMPSVERCISLFANAEVVVTDSFHGTCFSLSFNREFYVTRPPRFMARLTDILEMADATNRVFEGRTIPLNYKKIDFEKFNSELASARHESISFLKLHLTYKR